MTLGHLLFLGIGFFTGVFVCLLLLASGAGVIGKKIRNLAGQALFENSSRFMELADRYFSTHVASAKKDLDGKSDEIIRTVEPVKQMLDRYDRHLNEMEKERRTAHGAISERLMEMGRVQGMLTKETGNLVKALRVPHVRGRWGENTLRRVAELSGMSGHCDFSEQVTAVSGKGGLRPDMVVTLPGNRKIVIDAKVPLMAYLDALEAPDEAEQAERMKAHARHVAQHINQLSSKKYFREISPTPEFVVLFIPGENFFSAALDADPELIEKGIEKGVILATPTTLIALLKSVSYSWKQHKSYENAEEIRNLGKTLYTRLCTLSANVNQLGRDIEKTAVTFNRTVGAITTRVLPAAEKLKTFDVSERELSDLKPLASDKTSPRRMDDKEEN